MSLSESFFSRIGLVVCATSTKEIGSKRDEREPSTEGEGRGASRDPDIAQHSSHSATQIIEHEGLYL